MQLDITGGSIVFDDADAEIVMSRSWHVSDQGYAISRINGRLERLHRVLTGAKRGQSVDHINGVTLDNRRENLRICNHAQNMWNSKKKNRGGDRQTTSRFKGVSFDPRYNRWVAEVWKNHKKIFTKGFAVEKDAALAYDIVAEREFGQHARPNGIGATPEEFERVMAAVEAYKPRGKPKGGCVSFHKQWGRWTLRSVVNGRMKFIDSFQSREEADAARTERSNQLGGEA